MTAQETIRHLLKGSSWSQNRLGMAMGISPQGMGNAMARQDLRCAFAARALDLLGYDLVAVPKGSRLPNGSIRIDTETAVGRRARGGEQA